MRRMFTCLCALLAASAAHAQSSGSAGTLVGTVTDPSGAVVGKATVSIENPVTSYRAQTSSDDSGGFRLINVPANSYTMRVAAPGFASNTRTINVRAGIPLTLQISLELQQDVQTMEVTATGALVENEPSAHTDVDRSALENLPPSSPGAGLSQAVALNVGGVAEDSNGAYHPLGDHGQVSYNFDGQTISDQQSKAFSTQFPTNAIQSMELVTGSPGAEFGDKSSLVVNATTRSGLGATKAFGNVESAWGTFGQWTSNASLGFGNEKYGNFLAVDGLRSARFLDSPEFQPFHDKGNSERIFDRFDYQPNGNNVFHLNLFTARNWFQVPNDYDQLAQDQRQRVQTWNIAPGYQHTFNASTLLTVNAFARRDQVDYYGSRDPFNDSPVAISQNRFLTNYGFKTDISRVQGHHDVKAGVQIQQTRLTERFTLGITDPLFNAPCLNPSGIPIPYPFITNPSACGELGGRDSGNPNLQPGLVPYDLTRGGHILDFHGNTHINQYGFYIQDRITLGKWSISAGIRDDQYNGLSQANGVQPRLGISYQVTPGTVLRVAYSRTFETPFNENLILSSGTGAGGLAQNVFGAASVQPLKPGSRNQFNAGLQHKLGKYAIFDGDYFWKYTHNAFDFDVLFNTPITFPISWHNSKIDGVTGRVSTVNLNGLQAFFTFGHTRARYFPPEVGGVIPQSPLASSVFRIDHDQAFQSTFDVRYQRPHNGEFVSFLWRYDSGLVAGSVPDVASAFALTAAQQAAIGFHCGSTFATLNNPITSCATLASATRLRIPAPGTANSDTNPPRIAPRQILDLSIGTDNLLHTSEKQRVTMALSVTNLTNTESLYNFLSTFSGTHFLEPRAFEVKLGYVF